MPGLFHVEFLTGLSCRCLILVRISIAMKKYHDQKRLGEERRYFLLLLAVHHPGKSGQEPGDRT